MFIYEHNIDLRVNDVMFFLVKSGHRPYQIHSLILRGDDKHIPMTVLCYNSHTYEKIMDLSCYQYLSIRFENMQFTH